MSKKDFVRRLTNPVPRIGDTFKMKNPRDSFSKGHSWRCNGYMKLVNPDALKAEQAKLYKPGIGSMLNDILIDSAQKRSGKLMMWCSKDEATHVTGVGVAGTTLRLDEIEITGRVSWPEQMIQDDEKRAEVLIGKYVD